VVANAGVGGAQGRVEDLTVEDFDTGFKVNTRSVILLFQAMLPLLRLGSKFIYISSGAASIDLISVIPFPMGSLVGAV
jgi:NAD(P)-dependent dehydrogenase (short-subunit alcohol dehydrogenase family)